MKLWIYAFWKRVILVELSFWDFGKIGSPFVVGFADPKFRVILGLPEQDPFQTAAID